MASPHPDEAVLAPGEAQFYLAKDDQTFGPHSVSEIQAFVESGVILPDHLLWTEGMEQWVPVGQLLVLSAPVESPPPEAPKLSKNAEAFLEQWRMARIGGDGVSRRLSAAVLVAIGMHLSLLTIMTLGAATFFKLTDDQVVSTAPPEQPPMDVSLVTEEDPPPPEDSPPPPPPSDPPPPPALPDVPLPTVMQPPSPIPVTTPEPVESPVINPAVLPVVAAPVSKPAKPRRPSPVASSPEPSPAVDASPSDYLDAPPPSYPYQARQMREEGTVVLLVVINSDGEPVSVTIGQSSGFPILDRVAQQQVANHFRFKVGSSRVLRVPMDFHL